MGGENSRAPALERAREKESNPLFGRKELATSTLTVKNWKPSSEVRKERECAQGLVPWEKRSEEQRGLGARELGGRKKKEEAVSSAVATSSSGDGKGKRGH